MQGAAPRPAPELPAYRDDPSTMRSATSSELDALQFDRLHQMVEYVEARSPFWSAKLARAGVHAHDLRSRDDVRLLPMCTKLELLQDQQDHPPFGSNTCSAPVSWRQYFRTSGTTGTPLQRVLSGRDWDLMVDLVTMSLDARPGDRFLILPPVDSLLGPTAAADAVRRAGGLPILGGTWSTERRLEALQQLRPAGVMAPASYLLHLAEVARSRGLDPGTFGVRMLWSIGEPGAGVHRTGALLREHFGGADVVDGYGITELTPLATSCQHRAWLHLKEHAALVECLDPVTDEPVREGELGHLVITNLVGDTQPLLRYRTGDLGRLTRRVPCECGHTHAKISNSIEGRLDDMIWYRGVNVYPTAVEQVLGEFAELATEFEIVVDNRPALTTVTVRVMLSRKGELDGLQARVEAALKSRLGVTFGVEVLASGELPAPDGTGKTRRVRRIAPS